MSGTIEPSFTAVHVIVVSDPEAPLDAPGQQVLLGLRQNTGYGDGYYAFPAGHLKPGEKPSVGLAREMSEELGVCPSISGIRAAGSRLIVDHLKDYGPSAAAGKRFKRGFDHFFVLPSGWFQGFCNNEPNKCADLRFFPVNQLPQNMLPLSLFAFNHIVRNQGKAISFGWDNKDFPGVSPSPVSGRGGMTP